MGSTLGVSHRMWSQEEKLKIVCQRLDQNISPKELSRRFGVNPSLLSVWCRQYAEHGAERLRSQNGIPRLETTIRKKKEQRMEYTYNPKMDTDFINRAIGALIREYREKAGYSQNDLAEKSGLSQQHISQVELGKRNIGSDQLVMLSLLLGFDWAEIYERVEVEMAEITVAAESDIQDIDAFENKFLQQRLPECIKENRVFVLRGKGKIIGVMRYSFFLESLPCLDALVLDPAYTQSIYVPKMLDYWEFRMRELGYGYVMVTMFTDQAAVYSPEKFSYQEMGSFFLPLMDEKVVVFNKMLSQQTEQHINKK